MKVLLSIKPHFAEKIFSGEKMYEFRRSIFKNPDIKTVVVYASSPVQKVIGEFDIDAIMHEELSLLWKLTHKQSGITKGLFMDYFSGKQQGFAIKIKNAKVYKKPKCIRQDFNATPPQSFFYL